MSSVEVIKAFKAEYQKTPTRVKVIKLLCIKQHTCMYDSRHMLQFTQLIPWASLAPNNHQLQS